MAEPDDPGRPSEDIPAGTLVSRFRIISGIGSGGMGEVYLAHDDELNRKVAIKFLPGAQASDKDFQTRFLPEAQALAGVNHPNIVTIYDVSEYRGRPFIAMEYVEGRSLGEITDQQLPAIEDVINVATQICEALADAHRAGFVHGDIKPSNILLDNRGKVRIVDFGLAQSVSRQTVTAPGSTLGTLAYMSPEQLNGEKISPTSDLYSLGVLLYQMITGKLPFVGDYEASLVFSIENDPYPTMRQHRAEVPERLEGIVARLLAKNPRDRYADASDLIEDLKECLDRTAPVSTTGPEKPARRRGFVWSISAVLVAAALVVAVRVFYLPSTGEEPARKILAVLPFENLGPLEDEYFAEGITDEITTRLASLNDLGVISCTSARQYKRSERSLREIGRELGVDYVLEGTIRWDKKATGDLVRIIPRLIRVSDDTRIWTDQYDRTLTDIFAIQSDIATQIVTALDLTLGEPERRTLDARPTENLEAYDFYLRGIQYFNRSWERDDIDIATQMFQRAVDLDPDFALAYAWLSRGHESMYWEYYDRSEYRRQEAFRAVNRALQLQPGLVEGHLALGFYYYNCELNYNMALAEFTTALASRPNNADLYSAIAAVERRQGQLESAVRKFIRASELDPRSHLITFDVGLTYSLLRDYVRAGEYLNRTIMLAPDWPLAYIYKAWLNLFRDGDVARARLALREAKGRADLARDKYYWWLARIVETDYQKVIEDTRMGDDTAAYYLHVAQMNRLLGRQDSERIYADSARLILSARIEERPDDARFHAQLGLAYAGLRDKTKAMEHGTRALQLLPSSQDAFEALFSALNMAETLVMVGEYDEAIEQLEYLLSVPGFVSVPYLKCDPLWKPLENHPEFKRLLRDGE